MTVALAALLLSEGQAPETSAAKAVTVSPVVGGLVPKDQEWRPMTGRQRWGLYVRENYATPGAAIRTLSTALYSHIDNDPHEWEQGMKGYGRRTASQFGVFTLQGTYRSGLAAATGYETRYIRCKCDGVLRRAGHAIWFNFVTYDSDGRVRADLPRFIGYYGASLTARAWYPASRENVWYSMREGTSIIYIGGASNLFREFLPEIKKIFKRK